MSDIKLIEEILKDLQKFSLWINENCSALSNLSELQEIYEKWEGKKIIEERDLIDLIQCYYRVRDSDDQLIIGRSDNIVDRIAKKHGYSIPEEI